MPSKPLRWVHSGNFQLGRPFRGVEEVPDHLQEPFIESPFRAVRQVFDTTLAVEADFLVLTGQLVDVQAAGPRGLMFLDEQFERLAKRNIPVYWSADLEKLTAGRFVSRWVPDHVHRFSADHLDTLVCERGSEALAQISGSSSGGEGPVSWGKFHRRSPDLFSVGVALGEVIPQSMSADQVDYLAVGGRSAQQTATNSSQIIHDPGRPQGGSPQETGPRGCTLVTVSGGKDTDLEFVSTDQVRWSQERITIDGDMDESQLEKHLVERASLLVKMSPDVDQLISWTLSGSGSLIFDSGQSDWTEKLLDRLRQQFGYTSRWAWSVSLDIEPSATLPAEWYDQDTILGDFLRLVRQYQADDALSLEGQEFFPKEMFSGSSVPHLGIDDEQKRQEVLWRVAKLGSQLLGQEERSDGNCEEAAL